MWRAVRTDRYTYVETADRIPWLLFDNHADPYQLQNLAGSLAHRSLQEELKYTLSTWLDRTGDPCCSGEEMLHRLGLEQLWQERQRALGHGG